MKFVPLAALSQSDKIYSAFLSMTSDAYNHLLGLVLILTAVSMVTTIFFLIFTHDDKQISVLKSTTKKILLCLTIFLIIGSVYVWTMGFALRGKWDQNTTINHPAVSSTK